MLRSPFPFRLADVVAERLDHLRHRWFYRLADAASGQVGLAVNAIEFWSPRPMERSFRT
jgi:hypothetical protein